METKKNYPTMFIDTINTVINNNHSQTFFDSRNKDNKKNWESKKPTSVIEKKLNGIMKLVAKGININVILELENKNIEGILKEKNDHIVGLQVKEELVNIDIKEIKDIIILEV